jgi:cytochrome b involved in lipid metabolism
MNTKIIATVAGVILIGGGLIYIAKQPKQTPEPGRPDTSIPNETIKNPEPASSTESASPTSTPTGPNGYTLKDVQAHNTKADCWTAINGSVYNVTSWMSRHPGGEEAIISLCGIDGSSAFNEQHGSARRPNNELAGFKIGALK